MPEQFDVYQFLQHLRARWRLFALAGVVAVAGASGLTMLQTKQYTAVTRIVIDPPASMDPRASMSVSPIYLESLRSYELFATSDSLFQKALEKFELRKSDQKRSFEAWKKRVLRVEILRNTKILEIRATLPDPRNAHALARYIAAETVSLAQTLKVDADRELMVGLEGELSGLRKERELAREALVTLSRDEPIQALESSLRTLRNRRATFQSRSTGSSDGELTRLDQEIAELEARLAERVARRDEAADRLRRAEALEAMVRDAGAAAGLRGERLRLIDPGVVPERPSSPNLPLNVIVAALAALLGALLYASFEFGLQRRSAAPLALPLRVANRD